MNKDSGFYVSRIRISNLWGFRDVEIPFGPDVNLLIGRNATGKTSIINILKSLLEADVLTLLDIQFKSAVVEISKIGGDEIHVLDVRKSSAMIRFSLDESDVVNFEVPAFMRDMALLDMPPHIAEREMLRHRRHVSVRMFTGMRRKLCEMLPSIWLPVNRGIANEEQHFNPDGAPRISTVEDRLEYLLGELQKYRLQLDAMLSRRYKDFEKRVLELMLYNKKHDKWAAIKMEDAFSPQERVHLTNAFREIGLWDERIQKKIEEHFSAQEAVMARMREKTLKKDMGIEFSDIFIMPLIRRTKEMVESAREVDNEKQLIFSGIKKYVSLVNEFLNGKTVEVTDQGTLKINFQNKDARALSHKHLSSGEKQILILLTQALICENQRAVYIADEPELSLHVTWQEKLVDALRSLNGNMQLVIATHSPDIVGRRPVINLEKYYL